MTPPLACGTGSGVESVCWLLYSESDSDSDSEGPHPDSGFTSAGPRMLGVSNNEGATVEKPGSHRRGAELLAPRQKITVCVFTNVRVETETGFDIQTPLCPAR